MIDDVIKVVIQDLQKKLSASTEMKIDTDY